MATARDHALEAERWLDKATRNGPQAAAACAYVAEIEMKMAVLVRELVNPGVAGLDSELRGNL